jgi:hypothetical protein
MNHAQPYLLFAAIARALVAPEFQIRDTVLHPQGSPEPLKDPRTPRDSPAARHLVARAQPGSADDKLYVLILGAATNPASALLLDPTIEDKVVFAFIDGDFRDGNWGPGIYNWRNDIAAVQVRFSSAVDRVEQCPDNPRRVTVSSAIDVPGMLADYWDAAQPDGPVP